MPRRNSAGTMVRHGVRTWMLSMAPRWLAVPVLVAVFLLSPVEAWTQKLWIQQARAQADAPVTLTLRGDETPETVRKLVDALAAGGRRVEIRLAGAEAPAPAAAQPAAGKAAAAPPPPSAVAQADSRIEELWDHFIDGFDDGNAAIPHVVDLPTDWWRSWANNRNGATGPSAGPADPGRRGDRAGRRAAVSLGDGGMVRAADAAGRAGIHGQAGRLGLWPAAGSRLHRPGPGAGAPDAGLLASRCRPRHGYFPDGCQRRRDRRGLYRGWPLPGGAGGARAQAAAAAAGRTAFQDPDGLCHRDAHRGDERAADPGCREQPPGAGRVGRHHEPRDHAVQGLVVLRRAP